MVSFLFLAVVPGLHAEPVRLMPKPGETLVFERTYGREHLTKNPGQIVDRVILSLRPGASGGVAMLTLSMWKRGDRDAYESAGYATPQRDGSLRIALEGDAGSATLAARDGHVLLMLRGEDYLGLEGRRAVLEFTAKDADHRTFKLYPAK